MSKGMSKGMSKWYVVLGTTETLKSCLHGEDNYLSLQCNSFDWFLYDKEVGHKIG